LNIPQTIRRLFGHTCRCTVTVVGRKVTVRDGDTVNVQVPLVFNIESGSGYTFGPVIVNAEKGE
jgi:hypothetical protein